MLPQTGSLSRETHHYQHLITCSRLAQEAAALGSGDLKAAETRRHPVHKYLIPLNPISQGVTHDFSTTRTPLLAGYMLEKSFQKTLSEEYG